MLSFITANIREEKTFSDADRDALQDGLDRFSYVLPPLRGPVLRTASEGMGKVAGEPRQTRISVFRSGRPRVGWRPKFGVKIS